MHWEEISDPLIILAPELSNGTALLAMLGQHPEVFSFMETRLFTCNEMEQWIHRFGDRDAGHALIRTVAEIVFGGQEENHVDRARRWIVERDNRSTTDVFSELAAMVHPLLVAEGTPGVTYRAAHMCRIRRQFPEARYLHLVVDPGTYCARLTELFRQAYKASPERACKLLGDPESIFFDILDVRAGAPTVDPSRAWCRRHTAILKFLVNIPDERQMRIRVEDMIGDSRGTMSRIAEWLGLRIDAEALEDMLHPEQWLFAAAGPRSAAGGGDTVFLKNPTLEYLRESSPGARPATKDMPGSPQDGDRSKELAKELGYP